MKYPNTQKRKKNCLKWTQMCFVGSDFLFEDNCLYKQEWSSQTFTIDNRNYNRGFPKE